MSAGRAWNVAIVLALLAGAAQPALAATRWWCAQGPHFELYSSSERDSVVRLANALEDMADILGRAGLGRRTAARPVTVIIGFADKKSFDPHLPVRDGRRASFAGYVIHNPFGSWIGFAEFDERGRMVAQHEYAHTIVNQVFRHLPLTLNEGFAEYLSTFRADDQLAEFGHPILWHRDMIQTMRLRSLDELFQVDGAALNDLKGDDQALFYAESWAFVHYLLRADATGGRFTQFMRAAADGTPARTAFERIYPDEAWDKIPSLLKRYLDSDVFTVHQIPLARQKGAAPVVVRAASGAEVLSEIGLWRLYDSRLDTVATRHEFENALAQGADDGVARAGLGELLRLGGRNDAALASFRDASRGESASTRALTIAGTGMLLVGASNPDAVNAALVSEARAVLARSVARDSLDAAALGWFGRASLTADSMDAFVVSALEKASTANPGDEALASAYSIALAHTGRAGRAREVAEGSQALAHDREARHSTLAAIEQVALRDSVQALLDADRPAAAVALVDRLIASTPDGKQRSELLSVRANMVATAAQFSAIDEYNAGVEAIRQERPGDARAHFAAAQQRAVEEDLKRSAGQAVARLDSVIADRHAADAFERGVRAWKAGDMRAARSHFDSTRSLAMSPELRASATEASSNAGAHLELERGVAASRKGAWPEAIAAFQRAVALAKAPDLKAHTEKLLAEARQASGASNGTPAGHK